MSFFQQHYWSLYLDFIEEFKEVEYKGILIPLLCDFSGLLKDNGKLVQKMQNSSFKDHLKNKIYSDTQIQPLFDKYIQKGTNQNPVNQSSGKILLYEYVLRFPDNILKKYFDPSRTVILRKQKNMGGNKVIPTIYLEQYKKDVSEPVKKYQEQIKDIILSPKSNQIFRKNNNLIEKFMECLPELLENLAAINRFFEEVPISCIIVGTTEDPISRSIVAVANSKGIPSICMQHGLIMKEEGYLPVFSTIQAVYGEYEKAWYINNGVLEERIEIVGHPRFDELFSKKQMTSLLKKDRRVKYGKKRILIATQPNNLLEWEKLIKHLVMDQTNEIIIKPHPLELWNKDYRYYKMLSSKYSSVKIILNPILHLYDILPNVDVVVVNSSTVGLEAMLFGKPITVFKHGINTNYFDKLDDFVQSEPRKIADNINNVLSNESFKNYYETKRKEFLSFAYTQNLSGNCLTELINKLTTGIR
ncbi:hypothetical protein ACE198_09990 [Neobacillus sp. KR4-4]|uniref:capsular polysaccharide export protein, LipB/KpsS family n=1 Tax=Neobacillus sp. KR4-4 TaxID=3344872 RepID=UPI0035CA83E4